MTDVGRGLNYIGKQVTKLHSNQAINQAFDFAYDGAKNLKRFGKEAIADGNIVDAAKSVYMDQATKKWNATAIAGSYIVGSAGLRVVSGGGVTKDRNGNNDIIGIPFI